MHIFRQLFILVPITALFFPGVMANAQNLGRPMISQPARPEVSTKTSSANLLLFSKTENDLRELSSMVQRCRALMASIGPVSPASVQMAKKQQLEKTSKDLLARVRLIEKRWSFGRKSAGITRVVREDFTKINKIRQDMHAFARALASLSDNEQETQSGSSPSECCSSIRTENGCDESVCQNCCESMVCETLIDQAKKSSCFAKCMWAAALCVMEGVMDRTTQNVRVITN